MADDRGRVRCRARANQEVRWLTPSEVAALVPLVYELLDDEAARQPETLTQDVTVLTQGTRTRRRRA